MPVNNIYSDSELVDGIATSNESVFSYLYDKYSGPLFAAIIRVLPAPELACAGFSNALIQIFRNIHDYSPDKCGLYTWMLQITRIEAIKILRLHAGITSVFYDERARPMDGSGDDLVRMDKVIHEQPGVNAPDEGLIIELAYFQGLNTHEISRIMDIPAKDVHTSLRVALRKFLNKT